MQELSYYEMYDVAGGASVAYLIYVLLGVAAYKLYKSKAGGLSLAKFIKVWWSD